MSFNENLSVHALILYKSAEHTPSLLILPVLNPFDTEASQINQLFTYKKLKNPKLSHLLICFNQ